MTKSTLGQIDKGPVFTIAGSMDQNVGYVRFKYIHLIANVFFDCHFPGVQCVKRLEALPH